MNSCTIGEPDPLTTTSRHAILAMKATKLTAILSLALSLTGTTFAQTVHYVNGAAAGANTGASWTDAFTDLQMALSAAASGDEIWTAAGTYTPTSGSERTATFQLKSGVVLFGGFSGTESSRGTRDWVQNPTILSGDIGAQGQPTDNSYHVVTGSATDSTAILDGFTVQDAYANGVFPDNRGGGMRTLAGSPTIRHTVFRNNVARRSPDGRDAFGAGMLNENGSHPTLEDVRFEHNVSGVTGNGAAGGMANRFGSSPTLRDVVFYENEAGALAGGMANEGNSSPLMVRVRFVRNVSHGWTGGLDNYNGASPTLVNVTFQGNTCVNYGGGMTNDTNSNPSLVNVVFVGNRAQNSTESGAGGLQNNSSSPTLVNVSFAANEAPTGADAFGTRGNGTATIRSSIFWGNGSELVDETGDRIVLENAIVQGGFAPGSDIIDSDPLLITTPDPGVDGVWGTRDDNYGDLRLNRTSPGLDAGNAAHLPPDVADLDEDGDTTEALPVDLSLAPRVQEAALDLGAYEGGTSVSSETDPDEIGAALGPPFPNPSRGAFWIPFTITTAADVRISLVDVTGRSVTILLDETRLPGTHSVEVRLPALAAGTYFVLLDVNGRRLYRSIASL